MGEIGRMPSSFKRCEIGVSPKQPTLKAVYSALVVNWAVDFCFLERQLTAPPKVKTSPLVY